MLARKRTTRRPTLPMPALLWRAGPSPDVVNIPERVVLSIEGRGKPEGPLFHEAIDALYGIASALRFARKKAGNDFQIGPLEARWWAEPGYSVAVAPCDTWRWRLRIGVPSDVRDADVAWAIVAAAKKRRGKLSDNTRIGDVELERVPAQRLGRALHLGPYAAEGKTLEAIDAALAAASLSPARSHLEVYVKGPRRAKPAKLETVLLRETA